MAQDTINESMDRLKESIYYGFNLLNLPEFRGQPGESIEAFLKEFGRATATFGPERKCSALKRSLTGDAGIFAKSYLKDQIAKGDWKAAKEALRGRFLPTDRDLTYRTELRNMTYDKNTSTLLGYVDRYAKLYKKVHPKADDRELIGDIGLNLGADLVRKLNQLSPGWQSTEKIETFRALINRLEKDILAYERTKGVSPADIMSTVNKTVVAALEEPMKEIKTLLAAATKKPEESVQEAVQEALAAVQHSSHPRNQDRPRYTSKRKERDWEERRARANHRPSPRDDHEEIRDNSSRLRDLRKSYEQNFGRLNGNCYTCGGFHFKRHCPLENIDSLK